jgi:SAM-dependent methyltransferase
MRCPPADALIRFEEIYRSANGDVAGVPWADKAPRAKLGAWLAAHPGGGRSAIDVGCGLGDNAALIAKAGYAVTAFDLSETAVAWARSRQASTGIAFHLADLFRLSPIWQGAFDLVHETYNLQAMPLDLREAAARAIAALVAPGGTLLLLSRLRDASVLSPKCLHTCRGLSKAFRRRKDTRKPMALVWFCPANTFERLPRSGKVLVGHHTSETVVGPPIPPTLGDLQPFQAAGLQPGDLELFVDERQIRHVKAVYRRPPSAVGADPC